MVGGDSKVMVNEKETAERTKKDRCDCCGKEFLNLARVEPDSFLFCLRCAIAIKNGELLEKVLDVKKLLDLGKTGRALFILRTMLK